LICGAGRALTEIDDERLHAARPPDAGSVCYAA
jgi:hypothetical protein